MKLVISKDSFTFITKRKLDLTGFKCNKLYLLADHWHCVIKIPKNIVLGVNTINTTLPKINKVEFKGYGLKTKIQLNNKLLDHIEIGGPIEVIFTQKITIRGKNPKEEIVKIAVPPENEHQKPLETSINMPAKITKTKEGNKYAEIEIPKKILQRGFTLEINTRMKLYGVDIYSLCTEKQCTVQKSIEGIGKTKLLGKSAKLDMLLESLTKEESVLDVIKKIYSFLNENIKYRTNYQRYGAIYAVQTGFAACDEISDLIVEILKFIGVESRFVKGYFIKDNLKPEGHAWVELKSNLGWLPIDPTMKLYGVGMRWIKILSETKKGDNIVNVPRGVHVIKTSTSITDYEIDS